jgi:hypothetical protein
MILRVRRAVPVPGRRRFSGYVTARPELRVSETGYGAVLRTVISGAPSAGDSESVTRDVYRNGTAHLYFLLRPGGHGSGTAAVGPDRAGPPANCDS